MFRYLISLFSLLAVSATPVLAADTNYWTNSTQGYPYGMWGMMSGGMARMMGSGNLGWGVMGLFGWLWMILWTVISVLILVLLWTLIQKNKNGKK